MWPYSYDTCDLGTFPGQMTKNDTPAASLTGGLSGAILSQLPGQKTSACTCPGSDHPGPSTSVGRGVPEIDVFEAQINTSSFPFQGGVSQSSQVAPFDLNYDFVTTSPSTTVYNSTSTQFNSYKGGTLQQSVSAVTDVDAHVYGGNGYATYGFEYWSDQKKRQDGYVAWYSNGQPSWKMTAATVGPNSLSQVSQRLISEEPMVSFLLGVLPCQSSHSCLVRYL
jgi:beta-glucanase (GH16 family)